MGGSSEDLVSFVLFFSSFFFYFSSRGKGYFNLAVRGVRDSSSAGQSMIYVFTLEALYYFCRKVGRFGCK